MRVKIDRLRSGEQLHLIGQSPRILEPLTKFASIVYFLWSCVNMAMPPNCAASAWRVAGNGVYLRLKHNEYRIIMN